MKVIRWEEGKCWIDKRHQEIAMFATRDYFALERLGAPADELQDVAWLTYLSNVSREKKEVIA